MSIFDAFEPILLWLIQNVFDPFRICHLINSESVLWSIQDLSFDPFRICSMIHSKSPSLIHSEYFWSIQKLLLWSIWIYPSLIHSVCPYLIHSESVLWSIPNLCFDPFRISLIHSEYVFHPFRMSFDPLRIFDPFSLSFFDTFRVCLLIHSGSIIWSIQDLSLFDPFRGCPLIHSKFILLWPFQNLSLFDIFRLCPLIYIESILHWSIQFATIGSIQNQDPFLFFQNICPSLIHSE